MAVASTRRPLSLSSGAPDAIARDGCTTTTCGCCTSSGSPLGASSAPYWLRILSRCRLQNAAITASPAIRAVMTNMPRIPLSAIWLVGATSGHDAPLRKSRWRMFW
eukprot:7384364-Prymnesium_polylepis.4